jgi:hypothetical protein
LGVNDVHQRLVDAARMDLEAAGSPAFLVALVDAGGEPHLSPMVFSAIGPARAQAARLDAQRGMGEQVAVVSRETEGRRALFSVFDRHVERRLHRQLEMVEPPFAERDLLA